MTEIEIKNSEIMLALDLKELIENNQDVVVEKKIADEIYAFEDDDMIKIEKSLGSINITSAEKVTEEMIEKDL